MVGSLLAFPMDSVAFSAFTHQLFDHPLLMFGKVNRCVAKSKRLLWQRVNQIRDLVRGRA